MIERIKAYIDAHHKGLLFEVYNSGFYAENIVCEIKGEDAKKPQLIVTGILANEPIEVFRVWESWFKVPRKKTLEKIIHEYKKGDFPSNVCHHWCIRKLKNEEQFVLSCLSLDNYMKSVEIYTRK